MKRRNFLKISSQGAMAASAAPLVSAAPFLSYYSPGIIIQNTHFLYAVGPDGKNLQFTDKRSGIDYCRHAEPSWFASVNKNGKNHLPSSVSQTGRMIHLAFHEADVSAEMIMEVAANHIRLELTSVKGVVDSMSFFNMPLSLEGMTGEPFAACVLSLNLLTNVPQTPALQTSLLASCYNRFGLEGSKTALIGAPQENILPAIREVMQLTKAIPLSTAGGAWAKQNKEGSGSYLMNFGSLNENTADEWITTCRSLGFNQIDNHGGDKNFFTFGDLQLNKEAWPDGWDTFARINKKLHEAGISSIFHTYAFFIEKRSSYVTPVPRADLGYFRSFTLAAPVGIADTEIAVNESTKDISLTTGFFVRNGLTLRIDGELIEFTGVASSPPYKFTGCRRGVNHTKASAYQKNEKAFQLKEMFGMFVAGANTPLMTEIARHTAEIVNKCNFDGLYFDAIDGGDIIGGAEDFWYYTSHFIFDVARHLKRPVGMEFSSMKHHWWHYRSRWQAWDTASRGYKRFIDIHSAAIKSDEYEHGVWNGHLPMIKKLAEQENGRLLLPLHFGWWINHTWDPPQVEPTFPDDIEYLCCKMIGNDAGLSMQEVEEKTLQEKPLFRRLFAIIKQYEELRHKNYFSAGVKRKLRKVDEEYSLFREADGSWNFKPVTYNKQAVKGLQHPTAKWKMQNHFADQPLRLRLEILMSIKHYNDAGNITLTRFSSEESFKSVAAKGVSGQITKAAERTPSGESSARFTAVSAGESPKEGSWICMEKSFEPWLDLNNHQGLGVWVYGDGNGELLNLRIESPAHLSSGARGDHFITIDFTGWKYFELVEIESSRFSDYIWPRSDFYVYDSYRHTVKFKTVDKIQFWYNNLPAGKNISCLIGEVKALPLIPLTVVNPSLKVNGTTLEFPATIESGQYLELDEANDCLLYSPQGHLLKKVSLENKIPVIHSGENEISFSGSGNGPTSLRAQATIICKGDPLDKNSVRNIS